MRRLELLDNVNKTVKEDLSVEIRKGSKVSIAAACFSIYAFAELKKQLKDIDQLQFIFTSPTFTKEKAKKEKREFYIPRLERERSIYGSEFEIKLRNELNQKAIAKECADWIKNKVTFKSNVTNEHMMGFINVDDKNYMPINGFTTVDLGCERGNNAYYIVQKSENPMSAMYLQLFEQLWNDDTKLQEVTDEVIESITAVYNENSPDYLYFVTLYNIFNEFLEDVSEDVLPNEATGFKESKIWGMLYNFQKDAALAIINKLEKYNGCILADSVGLGKTFTALSVIKYYENRNKSVLVLCPKKLANNWNTYKGNYVNNPIAEDKMRYDVLFHTDLSRNSGMSNGIDLGALNWKNYDLVVIDESHRSIYKKYQDIFDYFDAMLLGLTATPKDEIDKNTYTVFHLERGVPTYAYELEQAVEDKYLVDYKTIEIKTKIMENGIHYSDLTEEEKEQFEEKFHDDETIDKDIDSKAVNEWLFNANTIDMVLNKLMESGLKVEGGDKIGKTIIFAKNSKHAEAIVERFHVLYPYLGDSFIKQIDYSINYVDTLIDDFSTKEKLPQIAVSVDMLDTGIDIPEILNLVFFKKVRSKSKFWQMIGRGTRLCENLYGGGQDKDGFLIFDYCNNFDFFRINPKGMDSAIGASLTEKIYNTKLEIIRELQDIKFQTEEYIAYRDELKTDLLTAVQELDMESFRVKMHQRQVEMYKEEAAWQFLNSNSVTEIKEHISPLVNPIADNELAKRFDYLVYTVDLAYLQNKNASRPIMSIVQTAEELSKLGTIPQVLEQKAVIERVQTTEFWDNADVFELETVRIALRDLIKFIERERHKIYYTDFKDQIIDMRENKAMYNTNDLKAYKKKVEFYLQEHKDMLAIYKLRNNKRLNQDELQQLEHVLWEELGSKSDYEKEYGDTPVNKLVRKIVGLDRQAANEAFSEFLSEEKMNVNQIRFVKLIIDYVVTNGMIDDNRVLMEEPFRTLGSITSIFKDNMEAAQGIMGVLGEIETNSESTIA